MIHPHTGNVIPVCNKFTLTASDNCGICPINTNPTIIIYDHLSYIRRLHDQKRKTILPQIAPSTAALPIIMIGKEGTAVNSSENRLEADPFQIIIHITISSFKCYIYLLNPMFFYFFKHFLHLKLCSAAGGQQRNTVRCFCGAA